MDRTTLEILSFLKEHRICTELEILNAFSPEKRCDEISERIDSMAENGLIKMSGAKWHGPDSVRITLAGSGYNALEQNSDEASRRRKENIRFAVTIFISILSLIASVVAAVTSIIGMMK